MPDNEEGAAMSSTSGTGCLSVPGAAALLPPPPFDFSNTGEWPSWIQCFEDYMFAAGLYQAQEEVKVRTLLYCMGPKARTILVSTCKEEGVPKTFQQVKSTLDDYFIHPVNEVYESARFHRRAQAAEETVDEFYTALCNMVKKCNYRSAEVQERLVRDRFVVGLRDSPLSDLLCRIPKLTLAEALIQVRQYEDAEKEKRARENQGQSRHEEPNVLNIDATDVTRLPGERKREGSCQYCGRGQHRRLDCPARRAVCHYCKKMGHFREVCRARKKSKNATLDTPHLEEVEDRTDRARFTRLAVNGHWVRFKIDSGAEVTVVPEDLPWVPELLDPEDVSLTGPGGQALQIRGSFSATLTWKDRTAQQRVYVLSSLSTPL
ncbi:uncharacterized protein LOC135385008 [Ornithodoros turicata]|uniref:uncharacterized protein LOC135385008 n=1 Tax=Ornithodoros turicata TaxID=34597 RepID=UPI003139F734